MNIRFHEPHFDLIVVLLFVPTYAMIQKRFQSEECRGSNEGVTIRHSAFALNSRLLVRGLMAVLLGLGMPEATPQAQAQAQQPKAKSYSFTFAQWKSGNPWDEDSSWQRHGGGYDPKTDGIPAASDDALMKAGFNTAIALSGEAREVRSLRVEVPADKHIAISPDKDGGNALTVHSDFHKSGQGAFKILGFYHGKMTVMGNALLQAGVLESPGQQHHRGTLEFQGELNLRGGRVLANRLVLGESSVLTGSLGDLNDGLVFEDHEDQSFLTISPGASLRVDGFGQAKPSVGDTYVIAKGFDGLKGTFDGLSQNAPLQVDGAVLHITYTSSTIELLVHSIEP